MKKHISKFIEFTLIRNIVTLFSVFCLVICSSCNPENEYKNPNRDDIIGKWKLVEVGVFRIYYQPYERQSEIIDCSNDNIIYDFQANNKLVITSSIADTFFIADTTVVFSLLFDSFNKGEHFYKYQKLNVCPTCMPGVNLCIDKPNIEEHSKKCFFCTALKKEQTMTIGTGQPDGNNFECSLKLIKLK